MENEIEKYERLDHYRRIHAISDYNFRVYCGDVYLIYADNPYTSFVWMVADIHEHLLPEYKDIIVACFVGICLPLSYLSFKNVKEEDGMLVFTREFCTTEGLTLQFLTKSSNVCTSEPFSDMLFMFDEYILEIILGEYYYALPENT